MLWHCYHRQVAKVHQQSKYLSKLTSSFYSLQSRRRKGIQPLRNVKIKRKKGCWCLLKKMVSLSWSDQGVISKPLTDVHGCIWQGGFFQFWSAVCSWLMNDCSPPACMFKLHLAHIAWSLAWCSFFFFAPIFFCSIFYKIPPHVPYKRHLNSLSKFPKNY